MSSADKWMQTEGLLRKKKNKPKERGGEENENFEMQTDND